LKEIPAISVIIPMYNAEKYISECLNSLLEQTFKNFEVIVVDDCSTDNSVEIVKNYAEKFDGRLIFVKMIANSGGGSAPRNKGAKLSRGEYLFFMDSDDFFTKTALEDMYIPAKEFNADAVYLEKYYSYKKNGENVKLNGNSSANKPVLEVNKQLEHLILYASDTYFWAPWTKFVRRTWAMENQIFFQELPRAQDFLWTLKIFTYAERFLRIPTAVYFYRDSPESITRNKRSDDKMMNFWISPVIKGLKEISDFMNSVEILKKRPKLRYAILDFFVRVHFARDFLKLSWQFPPYAVYEIFNQEFGKNLGENDVLVSFFCAYSNNLLKFAARSQQRIVELEKEIHKLKTKE